MRAGTVLGLDLGSNSIGWALVNEAEQAITAAGVRVFPEGVDRDQQGGEKSKNEERRTARGTRRQAARRARRKRAIRTALVRAGLLSEVAILDASDARRLEWENTWLSRTDPYLLRQRALQEKVSLYELGRIFLHLAQRRGFLSNRKTGKARKNENSEILKEISSLEGDLGTRTLGEYFGEIRASDPHAQVRKRHTRRDRYEREFDAIWTAQQQYYPEVLTDQVRDGSAGRKRYPCLPVRLAQNDLLEQFGIHGIIFFQRPMYWAKSVVGRCELEPKEKRCPRADRLAQRFRLLQEINNLRLLDPTSGDERALDSEERSLCLAYLSRSKEKDFNDIRKHLGMLEHVHFNLEFGGRKKLQGLPTDYALRSVFGKTWDTRSEEERTEIVQCLLDEEDETVVRQRAAQEWNLEPEKIDKLLAVHLPEGHANFSRKAIAKLLPALERGLPLTAPTGEPCALREAGYIQPHERAAKQRAFLPLPPMVTNPLVRQALYEVRRVVNATIRKCGKPDRIHIEMAREIKGSYAARQEKSIEMRRREHERDRVADIISNDLGLKPTRQSIDRFLLWEEQRHECIYSGKPISRKQLFSGEVHEDHILPRFRSLDNSLMNRVLCFESENALKGDHTPFEWLADSDPKKYERVLQAAERLPYPKAKRFRQRSVALEEFIARQFVDTAYITSQVAHYIQCLGIEIVFSKGRHTAELRHQWGLESILRDDGLNLKNREDHRHHAVDAIVVALTDRSRLRELAQLFKRGGIERTGEILNDPWPNFRAAVEKAINGINVSHKVRRKVRGALHEGTIYGPTLKRKSAEPGERRWAKTWVERPGEFVYRKTLESLTLSEAEHIRDERVKELVLERLARHGIKAGRKKKTSSGDDEDASISHGRTIPKEVWKEPLFLTPKNGSSEKPARIKKVRIMKKEGTIRPIRHGSAWVKPGKIHHVCIFEIPTATGKTKRIAEFVSLFDAVQRLKEKKPLISRTHPTIPNARFIMSLSAGEMVLGTHKGTQRLMCFVTGASTQKQLYFMDHTDARPKSDIQKLAFKANTLKARKVLIDPLGQVRWAND